MKAIIHLGIKGFNMGIQNQFFTVNGSTKTFPSTKHIATKSHMAVWLQEIVGGNFYPLNVGSYELISNAAVLLNAPSVALYSQIEVRVADTPDELGYNPDDIPLLDYNDITY